MKVERIKVFFAMLFAMAFWGFSFIWSKQVFVYYSPLSTIIFRLLLSALFLWLFSIFYHRLQKVHRSDYFTFIIFAFFQPFLYFIGENYGLNAVPNATITSVVISTIPLFTPLAAWWFYRERISILNGIGLLISFFGVLFVVMKDDFSIDAPLYGIALLFLAVFSAVAYSVLIVKLSKKYNVFTIITVQNTIGFVLFLPLFLYFDFNYVWQIGIKTEILLPLFALAVFASSLAYLFFTYGVGKAGITRANIFANIIPVFTAIYAFYVLDERLTWLNIGGIVLVIVGLSIAQLRKRKKKKKNYAEAVLRNH